MHTPAEASKLWCPMVRTPTASQARGGTPQMVAANRHPGGSPSMDMHNCIAARCAMWRWGRWVEGTEQVIVDDPGFGIGGKRVTVQTVSVPTHGFCGLAGLPLPSTTSNNK